MVAWFLVVPRFGIEGLLWGWFAAELAQVLYIIRLNSRFFAEHEVLNVKYPVRMSILSVVFLAGTLNTLPRTAHLPLFEQAALAVVVGLVILALDIPLFGLIPVWASLRTLVQRRLAARSA